MAIWDCLFRSFYALGWLFCGSNRMASRLKEPNLLVDASCFPRWVGLVLWADSHQAKGTPSKRQSRAPSTLPEEFRESLVRYPCGICPPFHCNILQHLLRHMTQLHLKGLHHSHRLHHSAQALTSHSNRKSLCYLHITDSLAVKKPLLSRSFLPLQDLSSCESLAADWRHSEAQPDCSS